MTELKKKKNNISNLTADLEDEFYIHNWDNILDLYYTIKDDYSIFGFFNNATASEFYDIIYKCTIIVNNKVDDDEIYDSDISDD